MLTFILANPQSMNSSLTAINLQPTHLHNNLLQLIPLQGTDFEKLYAVAADPSIWEQHPQKDRFKREVFQTFFDGAMQSGGAFLIVDAATGKAIGSSRYYDYDGDEKTIAVGYTFLAKRYWGGTYNGALKQLMLDYAFQFVDRVVLHIGPYNLRSQKAAVKIGAVKKDGTHVDKNGEERFVYEIDKQAFYKSSP